MLRPAIQAAVRLEDDALTGPPTARIHRVAKARRRLLSDDRPVEGAAFEAIEPQTERHGESDRTEGGGKGTRGCTKSKLTIHEEKVIKAAASAGSRFGSTYVAARLKIWNVFGP
jgi:hypothetical protein